MQTMNDIISIYKWGFTHKQNNVQEAKDLFLISGPCSAETEQQVIETAMAVAKTSADVFRAGVWKPRTRPGGFEGIGEKALQWLNTAKQLTGLPICVEVATAEQVSLALSYNVDILWIGARTTVNPFSVQEIADALKGIDIPVLVKNPVNPDVELWRGAIERLYGAGLRRIAAVHRGFSVYPKGQLRNQPYWDLVSELRNAIPQLSIITDPSHICGNAAYLAEIAQSACEWGTTGFMFETHCNPAQAWTDAKQQIQPHELTALIDNLDYTPKHKDEVLFSQHLADLRTEMSKLDFQTLDIVGKRMAIGRLINDFKKANNVAISQLEHWAEMFRSKINKVESLQVGQEFISELLSAIDKESLSKQNAILQSFVAVARK